MSLQSNLKSVKESFNSDEKILESAFTLEILWKRYRKYIIALIVCVIGVFAWIWVSEYIESRKAQKASSAYAKLLIDSTNEEALHTLKQSSPALYDMYRFFNTNNDMVAYEELAKSQNAFVRSLAQYEIASLKASEFVDSQNPINTASLAPYLASLESTKPTGLKNLALLQEAYLLFQAGEAQEAHQKLLLIPENTLFWEEAVNLKHYGLKLQSSKGEDK